MQHDGPRPVDQAPIGERLARSVPEGACTIVQVGFGTGWLATRLKRGRPDRVVYGVESPDGPRAASGDDLDRFFEIDLAHGNPAIEAGSVDSIVYADVLSRVADPLAMLERHRPLLSASGTICCSVPNVQHHSVVADLLRGTFGYRDAGLLDRAYLRLFTFAGAVQLLLDAGYAPDVIDRTLLPGAEPLVTAGAALLELLGVRSDDASRHMDTSHMVLRGTPLADLGPLEEVPLTFVVCVNDEAQLAGNLLNSPCLHGTSPHEVLLFRGCASAADGLNAGIAQAAHDFVVLVHQDVYIPKGWPARMVGQWRLAERTGDPIGIAGVFGVLDRRVPFDAIGRVVHRDRLLMHRRLPADVDGLDELLMVVPRGTSLQVDPALGWHLYGTDLALQAQADGHRVVVIDAPCHHNSLTGRVPWKYRQSERVLAHKWERVLPIHTNLSSIGSWLIESGDANPVLVPPDERLEADAERHEVIGELVARLRAEQGSLSTDLEQARLQVASMQASPFWRAREVFARARDRLARRR